MQYEIGFRRLLLAGCAASFGAGAIAALAASGTGLDRADLHAEKPSSSAAAALQPAPPVIGFAFGVREAQRPDEPAGFGGRDVLVKPQRAHLVNWVLCGNRLPTARTSDGPFQRRRGGPRRLCPY
jgi:hypothetical protein